MAMWLIRSAHLDFEEKAQFWSLEDGWVDADEANRFTDLEKSVLALPIGGEWIERDPLEDKHYDDIDDQVADLKELVTTLGLTAHSLCDALAATVWFVENIGKSGPEPNAKLFRVRALWRNALQQAADAGIQPISNFGRMLKKDVTSSAAIAQPGTSIGFNLKFAAND